MTENEAKELIESLSNQARLYLEQKKIDKAEPIYKRILVIQEKALGVEHYNIANTLQGLAWLYVMQKKYSLVPPLFERSVVLREKKLGKDHLDVAAALDTLTHSYLANDQCGKDDPIAKATAKRALAIREKTLKSGDHQIAWSFYTLGKVYAREGEYTKAISLYEQALVMDEKNYDSVHPNTTLNTLLKENLKISLTAEQGKIAKEKKDSQE